MCNQPAVAGTGLCPAHGGRALARTEEVVGLLWVHALSAAARLVHIALYGDDRAALAAIGAILDRLGVKGSGTGQAERVESPVERLKARVAEIEARLGGEPR